MSLEEQLLNAMIDLEEETSYDCIRKLLEKGGDPKKIIEILRNGVEIIGEKFIKKEYFLTELVMAGEIFQQAAKILEPVLKAEHKADKSSAIVVMGTVKGDVHDIGKNIFTTLLQTAGIEVYDIGVDVPPESMKETTEMLKAAGLRDKIKIIIGGLPVDELWMRKAGADAFTDNAFKGVKIVSNWIKEGLV